MPTTNAGNDETISSIGKKYNMSGENLDDADHTKDLVQKEGGVCASRVARENIKLVIRD